MFLWGQSLLTENCFSCYVSVMRMFDWHFGIKLNCSGLKDTSRINRCEPKTTRRNIPNLSRGTIWPVVWHGPFQLTSKSTIPKEDISHGNVRHSYGRITRTESLWRPTDCQWHVWLFLHTACRCPEAQEPWNFFRRSENCFFLMFQTVITSFISLSRGRQDITKSMECYLSIL